MRNDERFSLTSFLFLSLNNFFYKRNAMIRHIVLFKLKPFTTDAAKAAKLQEIKIGLEALPELISELKLAEVGINMNPAESFDISLVTEFDTMTDLEIYVKHPDHQAVAKIIREVLESRACVDSVW